MNRITKVFHTLEQQEMSLSEYETFLREHRGYSGICAIRCVECGDFITYCNGDKYNSYFKHSPTKNGHSYCSLYSEGYESNFLESILRKKLFKEENIYLNLEIVYCFGAWKCVVLMPTFNDQELAAYEQNHTKITIKDKNDITLFIDKIHFKQGTKNTVTLLKFPEKICIKIEGDSSSKNYAYEMEGFVPNNQLFTTLLSDSITTNSTLIGSQNIVAFKKVGGKVYTGRSYYFFCKPNHLAIIKDDLGDCLVREIRFSKDKNFNYALYEVVFNNLSDKNQQFCFERHCELVEDVCVEILWPPIKTVGNYKYYSKADTNMFISFENNSNIIDIASYSTRHFSFKIKENSTVVTYLNLEETSTHQGPIISSEIFANVNLDYFNDIYFFKNNVLMGRYQGNKIVFNNQLLCVKSQLERIYYISEESDGVCDWEEILRSIRYTRNFVDYQEKYEIYLLEKYKNNTEIIKYLELCKRNGTINKNALKLMMEDIV